MNLIARISFHLGLFASVCLFPTSLLNINCWVDVFPKDLHNLITTRTFRFCSEPICEYYRMHFYPSKLFIHQIMFFFLIMAYESVDRNRFNTIRSNITSIKHRYWFFFCIPQIKYEMICVVRAISMRNGGTVYGKGGCSSFCYQ